MSVRIRVYDSRIHALSMPGGDIYRWASQVRREIRVQAELTCPIAVQDWGHDHIPGRLKASHGSTVRANGYGVFINVSNSAPYAKFVHDGTSTPIVARGPYMKFSIDGKVYRKKMVRGQRARRWLSRAQITVMRRHGIT